MKKIIIISTVLCCCKQYEQNTKSLETGDDEVKIAINYLGNIACTNFADINANMDNHKLDGRDGELAVEEFKNANKNDALSLSGDKFLEDNSIDRSIEAIEAKCRRLILSIDADSLPKITVTQGQVLQNQHASFNLDFSEFKPFTCRGDFCTSAKIQDSKRYFAYIEPDSDKTFSAELTYTYNSATKNNKSITLKNVEPRTEAGKLIKRCFTPLGIDTTTSGSLVSGSYPARPNCSQTLQIDHNSKDYLRANNVRCAKGAKGLAILIGNGERIASDCSKDKTINITSSNQRLVIKSLASDNSPRTTLTFDQSGSYTD